ncbi:MAG TPA: hypothetical protein VNT79_08980 [Phycisphaerae bacterium]|nr:hypothetical protein [Phycisphaerae bacterium]
MLKTLKDCTTDWNLISRGMESFRKIGQKDEVLDYDQAARTAFGTHLKNLSEAKTDEELTELLLGMGGPWIDEERSPSNEERRMVLDAYRQGRNEEYQRLLSISHTSQLTRGIVLAAVCAAAFLLCLFLLHLLR